MVKLLILILLVLSTTPLFAEMITVAVASNFAPVLKQIAARFEQKTNHRVKISVGSTGKHYAQIKNGAPFDAFFAADTRRPALLDKEGIAIADSRFTYAQGKLVLWSPDDNLVDTEGRVLESTEFDFLAVANPKLAPYGKAAQEVLQHRGLWNQLRKKMVRGENIGQTFQFVKTGNAQLGFVAASQLYGSNDQQSGSLWQVPQQYYSVIKQQVVLLTENPAAVTFLNYVRSEEVLGLIRSSGYDTP